MDNFTITCGLKIQTAINSKSAKKKIFGANERFILINRMISADSRVLSVGRMVFDKQIVVGCKLLGVK